jgi:hypothetical protein
MVSELALFDKILGIRVKGCHWYELRQNQRADGNAMTYNTVNGVFEREEWVHQGSNIETVFNIPGRFQTDRDQQRDGSIRRGSGSKPLGTCSDYFWTPLADYRHVSLLVDFMAQSGK